MGSEVNINPFGYDSYKDLKKEIERTKDEDGRKLSSSRSDAAEESIFNKDEKEVTKSDFLDRLEEIGLDDDAAAAMWEILNIDSQDASEDILDSDELDKLIQMYGDDMDSDTDWKDEPDSVSIKSFLKYVGNEKEIKQTTSSNEVTIVPVLENNENSDVSINELDGEKYSTDRINKDKDEILNNKSQMDEALAKIKNGEEKPSSDWGNGLIYYNIALSDGKRAYVRYENGSIISLDLVKLDRNGNETHLSRSSFDSDGNMDALYLDHNKSGKSEKTALFNKDGSLSSINYDSNENGSAEASAKFENGDFKSILTSSSDNGKFDKEFATGENGQYENGYKLDENGNRIIAQPKVEQQTVQEPVAQNINNSITTKPKENSETPQNKGDKYLTDLRRREREELEAAKKEEVIAKGKPSLDENGNTEYLVYNNKVYNPDGSASTLMQLDENGKIISKKEAQKIQMESQLLQYTNNGVKVDSVLYNLIKNGNKAIQQSDGTYIVNGKPYNADGSLDNVGIACKKYNIDKKSPMGIALTWQNPTIQTAETINGEKIYIVNNQKYDTNGNIISNYMLSS